MADKYLQLNTTTGRPTQVEATVVSAGAGNAGDVVALDSAGKLDTSVLPAGVGGATISATASEALAAGDLVNFHDVSGTKSVRKANATDATKPAHGFVIAAVSSSATATVYTDGQNTKVALGSFVAADVGKKLFLSAGTAGGVTLTPPVSTGNLVQAVGEIVDVGSDVTIDFRAGDEIVA